MKLFLIILSLLFSNFPRYNTCVIDEGNSREKWSGEFEIQLTSDSLFVYLNNKRFDSYKRDEGLLYKNNEMYWLIFNEGTCKILKPRQHFTMLFYNG